MSMNGNIIYSIEGNIGSGKSTLVRYLGQKYYNKNVIFIEEPVDEWNTICDNKGTCILECFYNNKDKYAFSFQMMAYITRLNKIKIAVDENTDSIIITERSLLTDKMVFEKMLYDDGYINDIEHQIYIKWFDVFNPYSKIMKLIYLSTEPKKAHERLKKRAREGEECVSLEYLSRCHDYHQVWMKDFTCSTLILDGNIDNEDNNKQIDYLSTLIHKFLNIQPALKETSDSDDEISAVWLTGC